MKQKFCQAFKPSHSSTRISDELVGHALETFPPACSSLLEICEQKSIKLRISD